MRRIGIKDTDDLDSNFHSEDGLFALLASLRQKPKSDAVGQAKFVPLPEALCRALARYIVERYLGRRLFYDVQSLCVAAVNPLKYTKEQVEYDSALLNLLLAKVGVVSVGDLCANDLETDEQRELMFERFCDEGFVDMAVREKWFNAAEARLVARHAARLCDFVRSCVREMAESELAAAELEAKFATASRAPDPVRPSPPVVKSTAMLGVDRGTEVRVLQMPPKRWDKWVPEAVARIDDVAEHVREHVLSLSGDDRDEVAAAALAFTREVQDRSAFSLALRLAIPGGMAPVLGPLMADPESELCKADVAAACAVLAAVGVRPSHFFIEQRDPHRRGRRGDLLQLVPGPYPVDDDSEPTVVALCDRNGPGLMAPLVVEEEFVRKWRRDKMLAEEHPFSQCICKSGRGERCEADCKAFVPVGPLQPSASARAEDEDMLSSVSTSVEASQVVESALTCLRWMLPDYPDDGKLRSRQHVEAVVAAQAKPDVVGALTLIEAEFRTWLAQRQRRADEPAPKRDRSDVPSSSDRSVKPKPDDAAPLTPPPVRFPGVGPSVLVRETPQRSPAPMSAPVFARRLREFYEWIERVRRGGIELFIDRLKQDRAYGKTRSVVAHAQFWNLDPASKMPSHIVLLGVIGIVLDVLFRKGPAFAWGKCEPAVPLKPRVPKAGASAVSPPPARSAPVVDLDPPGDAVAFAAAVAAIDVDVQSAVAKRTYLPYGSQWQGVLNHQVTGTVSSEAYATCGFAVAEKRRTEDQKNAKNAYFIAMQKELQDFPFLAAVLYCASESRVRMGADEVGSPQVFLPVSSRSKVESIPLPLYMRRVTDLMQVMAKSGHLDHVVVWQYVKEHLVEVYDFVVSAVADNSAVLELAAFIPEYAARPVFFPLPVARAVPRCLRGIHRACLVERARS